MTVVIADSSLPAVLANLKDKAEVRDTAGNVLGFFTPSQREEELLYQHADQIFLAEEIAKQLAEQPTGYTFEQVVNHLQTLEKP